MPLIKFVAEFRIQFHFFQVLLIKPSFCQHEWNAPKAYYEDGEIKKALPTHF